MKDMQTTVYIAKDGNHGYGIFTETLTSVTDPLFFSGFRTERAVTRMAYFRRITEARTYLRTQGYTLDKVSGTYIK